MKTTVFSHIRKHALLCIMLLILISESCVDPLSVPGLNSKRLVVDGLITNQAGPHKVQVYYTMVVNEKDSVSYPQASVAVMDDLGNHYAFTAYDSGVHKSNSYLYGEVGRTYTLEVKLKDGTVYRSTPQLMNPAGEIENIYAEFEPESINQDDIAAAHDSYAIYIDSKGDNHGLYRWRTTGTYEVLTFPELKVKFVHPVPSLPAVIEVPDPLPCSGFYYDTIVHQVIRIDECECCNCWITDYSDGVKISNGRYVSDNEFNRVFVARVPFDELRFHNKYRIQVEQLSLSDDVYEFWKTAKSQEGNSNIFQANIAQASSNITNDTDPSEHVLGCFAASAITQQTLFIPRSDAPKPPPPTDTVIADCRTQYKHSTNHRPPFW